MKIRALRTIRTDVGNVKRGNIAELSASIAKQLIDRGLAEAVDDDSSTEPAAEPAPKPHVKAKGKPKPQEGAAKAAPSEQEKLKQQDGEQEDAPAAEIKGE